MKIAVHMAHPAHLHLFLGVVLELQRKGHRVVVTYNDKDVLSALIEESELAAIAIKIKALGDIRGKASLARQFAQKLTGFLKAMRRIEPDLILGTPVIISLAGRYLGIQSLIVNEDDFDVIRQSARLGYPFATNILCPHGIRTMKWTRKSVQYPGYHELAYLHPKRFTPDPDRLRSEIEPTEPFFLLRFSALAAHHDAGKRGINWDMAREIIDRLQPNGRVMISSERELEPEFEPYRFPLHPRDMHHAMAYARMVVADSQTMTAEAAVLGTPVLRFNDFVGKLSYLEELEHTYGLTKGIPTTEPDRLLSTIEEWLNQKDLRSKWKVKRERMLRDKIDVTAFFVWFIENYPGSVAEVKAESFDWGKFK